MTVIPSDDPPLASGEAAEQYAALGWQVIPIIPGKKHPGVNAWQDAATDNLDTIRNWWNGLYRGHGVGVACGNRSDIWVLDIDNLDALTDLESQIGELPATVTSIPGSRRGLHLFFQWDPDQPITNGAARNLPPGIDVRGEGGQVVLPPTTHPNGTPYEWAPDGDPWSVPIAEAPQVLYNILLTQPEPPTPPSAPTVGKVKQLDVDDDSIAEWARHQWTFPQLLEQDGWTLSHCRGDDTYWTRPGKDPRHGHSAVLHGHGPLVVFSTEAPRPLLDPRAVNVDGSGYSHSLFGYYAATRHNGDRSQTARELRRERQRREAAAQPATAAHTAPSGGDAAEPPPAAPPPPGRLVDLEPWLTGTVETITPDILPRDDGNHILYRGQLNWIHGDSGSGKTWIALAAARHEITHGRHVLWIHYEDPNPGAVTERLLALGAPPETILNHFHYWDPEGEGLARQVPEILATAATHSVDLIVIDSIGEALNADGRNEDSDAEVGPWIVDGPRQFVNHGHTFIGIDHGTKNAQNPLHPSGSKRKRAAVTGIGLLVEAVVAPTRTSSGIMRIKCAKDRHGTYQQGAVITMVHVDHDILGGLDVTLRTPVAPQDQEAEDRERLVRAVVREVEMSPGLSSNGLSHLLPPASRKKHLSAIQTALDQGLILNVGTASNTRLVPVDNSTEVEP